MARIIYQRSPYAPASPEHVSEFGSWLRDQRLVPADVPVDSVIVVEDGPGELTLLWREYVREGHRRVTNPDGSYRKTEWRTLKVRSAPPTFVALDRAEAI